MKLKSLLSICLVTAIFISCQDEPEPSLFKQQLSFDIDNGVMNTNTYIEANDAHSGKKYSRADVGNNYGFGYTYFLPDSLIGKLISVDVNAWVRTGDLSNKCDLIVSASSRDSVLLWLGTGSDKVMTAPNQWSNVSSVINLSPELTSKPNLRIMILSHNMDAKSYFDVDDINVTIYETKISQ